MNTAGTPAAGAPGNAGAPFTLTSPVVTPGMPIAKKYRCTDFNMPSGPSPELHWSGGPGAMSYAMTMTDLTSDIMHWTLWDIPPTVMSLPEGVPTGAMPAMPAGAKQSPNSFEMMTGPGYFGPCGGANANMYEFEVYALDVATLPGLSASSTAMQARAAIDMHTLPMGTAKLGFTSSSQDP
jgi:Raf kinase inhibitor-like YbhB/YbcL family protein